jgi:hypothetical protein
VGGVMKRVPNYNTFADIVDRLIVEINKLAWFENKKREESLKPNSNAELITMWDRNSRNCCEYRDLLKRELDAVITDIVNTRQYETVPACRTFAAPPKSVVELLDEMCSAAPEIVRQQLTEAFEHELERSSDSISSK